MIFLQHLSFFRSSAVILFIYFVVVLLYSLFVNTVRIAQNRMDNVYILRSREVLFYYHPIAYYWTVPLILDHSYLVGI